MPNVAVSRGVEALATVGADQVVDQLDYHMHLPVRWSRMHVDIAGQLF